MINKRNAFRCGGVGFFILACWMTPAQLPAQVLRTNNVSPVADAYVQNGTGANINFGSANTLIVQANNVARNNYDTYIRFSLTTVSNLYTAKLRFRARVSNSATVAATLYATSTNWGEATLTWNNKPSRGTSLASVNVSGASYAWYEIDVSNFVLAEKAAGRAFVAWCLHNNTISSPNIEIQSREAASANRPVLSCTITNIPPTVALTQPANNANFLPPANININANAFDGDGSITQVTFYRAAVLLGTDTSAPYTFNWNNVSAGAYTLTARAWDNNGVVRTSTPVNITVNSAPAVTMTSPSEGAVFHAPANVTLSADASDTGGSITQVQFYDGTTLLNTDTSSPYSFLWNNAPADDHALRVQATDNLGAVSTSSVVNVTINQRPTVSLTTPANGAVIISPASVIISANAADADGSITKVEFYDGTSLLSTDTTASYSYVWAGGSLGSHALTARAYDNRGAISTSSVIAVTINLRPTITLTAPAQGTVLTAPADVTISAAASDSDGNIVQVQFYDGPTLLNTSTTAPYTYFLNNISAGNHALTARAYDNLGAVETSAVATVTVNLRPLVNITSPANATAFPLFSDVAITAAATDPDGSVSQVRFLVDGSAIGTNTVSPYGLVWKAIAGSHTLTAEVTDNNGTVAISPPVVIHILALDRDTGLTGYWKFEESAGAVASDSSGHGHDGTLNAPAWAAGKVGSSALALTSATGMSVPNAGNTVLPSTGRPFSVSMWIKPTDLSLLQTVEGFLIGNASGLSGWHCGVTGTPDELQFRVSSLDSGGTLNLVTPAPLLLNSWAQLALTFNGDVATLYLNGTKLGSAAGTVIGNTAPLRLGSDNGSYVGLPAQLDDLRTYNRELTPVEFGLTGHWNFEENAGLFAYDTSGHDNVATLTAPFWTAGRLGNRAVQFNGGFGWMGNDNNHLLPESGQPFSVSFWFSPDSLPSGMRLLMSAEEAGISGWRLALLTAGLGTNILSFSSTASGGTLSASGQCVLLPGQWHKLTVTYSGSGANLYLDSQWLGNGTGTIIGNTSPVFFAGDVSGTPGLPGKWDELRVYNRELSLEEISLQGHWRLDEGDGNNAGDSSGNGHIAQLTSGNWTVGQSGFGSLNLQANPVTVANQNYAILPPTGGPFSLSMRLYPYSLPVGYSGLLASHATAPQGTNGWQLAFYRDAAGTNAIRFWAVDNGGSLNLWASAATLNVSSWNKLDVTFNGGIATIYINGFKINSDSGGIIGSTSDLKMGGLNGIPDLNGAIDEVKVFNRALAEAEIGPVAKVEWETVWMNTTTNIPLPGSVPAGRMATYALATGPTNGIATLSAQGTVSYTPNPGYKGPDAFTYTVSDGESTTTPTVVALSVVRVRYLSPTGGISPPLDGTSPEKAWLAAPFTALDEIYRTNQYYDCFYYFPGTYETRGWKYAERKTANPGCKHIGSGMDGLNATIVKMVGAIHSTAEESIFASYWYLPSPDGFEVRDMVLDCNAANNPKYAVGEPITIAVPLPAVATVDRIKLFWNNIPFPNSATNYTTGHAQEYTIFAKDPVSGQNDPIYVASGRTGGIDEIVLTPAVSTREIQVRLTLRGSGVAFYSLRELEVFAGGENIARDLTLTVTNLYGSESVLQWNIRYDPSRMVDGDYQTQWTCGSQGMCGAIAVGGNNLKFINLKIIGFGTKALRECFPLFIAVGNSFSPVEEFGNILIDHCVVAEPATSNADGISAVVMVKYPPFSLTNHVIRNTQVSDLKPFFNYSHGFSGNHVENCVATDVHTAVYFEPDPYTLDNGEAFVVSNRFVNVQSGIIFNFHPDIQYSGLVAIGNEFVLSNDGALGFAAFDSGTSSINNVTALNNIVRFADWSPQPSAARAFHSSNIRNALFGNNIVALNGVDDLRVSYGMDSLPLGYRRAWLHNLDLSGLLLPVTYHNGSGIVPASQQQWP